MADAPDEYLDPITYTLMQDPVKLPSGAVMDRPNVMRMLLSDPRDPTTRYDQWSIWPCKPSKASLEYCFNKWMAECMVHETGMFHGAWYTKQVCFRYQSVFQSCTMM